MRCFRTILVTVLLLTVLSSFSATLYKQVDFLMVGYRTTDDQPLTGGKVYIYESGGVLTPETLYQDRNGSVALTNPIVLDAYGRAEAYGNGVYRFIIKTSEDELIETIDGYECYSSSSDATTALTEKVEEIETTVDAIPDTYLKLDASNDPITADLSMNDNQIQFLGAPSLTHEAVNKEYSDANVGGKELTDEAYSDGVILVYENGEDVFEKRDPNALIFSEIGYDTTTPLIKIVSGSEIFTLSGGTPQGSKNIYEESEFTTVFTYVSANRATFGGKTYQINYIYNGYGRSSDVGNAYVTQAGTMAVLGYGTYGDYTIYWTVIGIRIDE